jgi:flagellar biosynthesis protein FliR
MTLLAADIIAKFYTFMWPLARITAALMTVPVLSVEAANTRVRLMLSLALTVLVFPMFQWPTIDPMSSRGLLTLFNEIAIGVLTGFTLQVVTSALLVAGQSISASMGLSMASLLDPNFGNVPVISQLFLIMGTLIFLGIGGHLLLISIILDSFRMLPVGESLIGLNAVRNLLAWSSMIFLGSLMIALPVMATLVLINIGLGVVTRAAPSLNIFAVGFPAMIIAGFLVLYISLGSAGNRIQWLWMQGFSKVREILGAG